MDELNLVGNYRKQQRLKSKKTKAIIVIAFFIGFGVMSAEYYEYNQKVQEQNRLDKLETAFVNSNIGG